MNTEDSEGFKRPDPGKFERLKKRFPGDYNFFDKWLNRQLKDIKPKQKPDGNEKPPEKR
jgi:hypothetical protein